ncbi:TPA: VOC family protein [Proteus mirabilis]|uniref:VOC family protein n=1 Tax=Proteus mirabilis TaxID=584 RepID=UPI0018C55DCB|nr:VOC family protein [Proteus mirabilis]HDT0722162.1 VOC family protein [Proteus mirabilis]HDT0722596.1 VOC family protein [Proteus mirabilis]HEJ9439243.1 VOC family protein [Proteus mirabilis]HEJ9440118.1 VOC family protein [Proteus mirabilis]
MILGLNHLTIAVTDVKHSFDFYCYILGFKPEAIWEHGAYLSLGDLWLCLSYDEVDDKIDYTHYAFSITEEDMQPFKKRLKRFGVIEWKQNKSEGESIYFLDPDGHKLEVHVGNLQTRLQYLREKNQIQIF